MKRIAILACLRSGNVCTGASCMRAFSQRKASFACYGEEPLELVAFMRCNGCQNRQGQLCPAIAEITEALQQWGMTVVRGTHWQTAPEGLKKDPNRSRNRKVRIFFSKSRSFSNTY